MTSHSFQAYKIRLFQVICGLAVFALGLYAVRHSMGGSAKTIKMIASGVGAVVVVLALGDKYWILLPALQAFGISLPGLRFSPQELGCLAVVGIRFVRLALHLERPGSFDRAIIPATMLVSWMAFVFLLNPAGFYVFGNSMIGGRFYFQVLLGYVTLSSFSQLRLRERDAKLMFFSFCAALILRSVLTAVRNMTGVVEDVFSGSMEETNSNYKYIFASSVFILLFSRWSILELFSSNWRMVLLFLSAALSIYSGKRRIFGTLFLVPLLRAFLTGRERMLAVLLFVVAFFLIGFVAAGDGTFYRLPKSATRALSVAIPKYRHEGASGLKDPFREALREEARRIVRENPWVGRKGFAMSLLDSHLMYAAVTGARFSAADVAAGFGYGASWHSAWYAYAADFGLPCVFLWALFSFSVLRFAFRSCRTVVVGTYLPACCRYYALTRFISMAFSYTSGHSASTTMDWFISFGIMLALVNGYLLENRSRLASSGVGAVGTA